MSLRAERRRAAPAFRPAAGVALVRLLALLALIGWALATPGFFTRLSLFSLLTAMSFVGCVAVGMTFIALTGNVISLALGATLSACSLVFLGSLPWGLVPALGLTLLFGAALTGVQGVVIGVLRANAILVSIAALALIGGGAQMITGGQRIMADDSGFTGFPARLLGLPFEFWLLLGIVVLCQLVQSATVPGRAMVLAGSNRRAAEAAGVNTPAATVAAYVIAGLCTAAAGILLGARYGAGDMDLGSGYDARAIAAVLVGGTSITGGAGGVWRSFVGVAVIATLEMVLRLRGYSDLLQGVVTGALVLLVIVLQAVGERQ